MAVLDDLKPHKLTPTQAVSMAQNQPFLTLRLLSGAIHSCSHARNDEMMPYLFINNTILDSLLEITGSAQTNRIMSHTMVGFAGPHFQHR